MRTWVRPPASVMMVTHKSAMTAGRTSDDSMPAGEASFNNVHSSI